ncbi:uncharacterized protein MYCFIDRAFT_33781 [Pseudocercospora fijiensis CIRAD86]|uniref:HAUS augmin-like complex subunit 1 n=1 Tax=Pseudocercospora fijiensis (strain CIRAD86) TaxID=383855 RepID=M3ALP4_PSEFD|nr:uncharacterized protein MYCFIDRAFT_33781 [Pseudocercospora fijiensis CIRAD86]EME78073.1 hypothetical protein MYCFIDRAFT_33781 [Pseudocercospora fijiensis CIRAD86]
MDSDWTASASALFSPSKARAQQAQAKDWAAVDAWICRKYGSRLPPFERNEDTLHALLTLANLNESADEQRNQIDKIEKAALQSLTKRNGNVSDEVLHALQAELANETHLDTLAETTVALDCPNADIATIGKELIDLSSAQFEMQQQIRNAESQLANLTSEQAHLQTLLNELHSDAFQTPADTSQLTNDWMKSTKTLKAKVAEYEERLSANRPSTSSGGSFESTQQRIRDIAKQRAYLSTLEAELSAFRDLPSDARSARAKLEEARENLRKQITKRDRLFESLVET